MLLPKKVKHRKWHKLRRRNKGVATRTNTVAFGEFGLCAQGHAWLTSRQIEATRKVLTRFVRRSGKMWIRVFPYKPVTSKPVEVRMGKGKGDPEFWVDVLKRGRIIYELEGVEETTAKQAMKLAQRKFAVRTRFVKREK